MFIAQLKSLGLGPTDQNLFSAKHISPIPVYSPHITVCLCNETEFIFISCYCLNCYDDCRESRKEGKRAEL